MELLPLLPGLYLALMLRVAVPHAMLTPSDCNLSTPELSDVGVLLGGCKFRSHGAASELKQLLNFGSAAFADCRSSSCCGSCWACRAVRQCCCCTGGRPTSTATPSTSAPRTASTPLLRTTVCTQLLWAVEKDVFAAAYAGSAACRLPRRRPRSCSSSLPYPVHLQLKMSADAGTVSCHKEGAALPASRCEIAAAQQGVQ